MSTYRSEHMITSDKTRVHPMPCIASPRFPTVKEVASCLSISVSTVWRHAKEDETFPRPLKIGVGATRWAVTEIEAYEGSRKLTH